MKIIQQSTVFQDIISQSPLISARMALAESRLRLEVNLELVQCGIVPNEDQVTAIIEGLPPDVRAQLIAERA